MKKIILLLAFCLSVGNLFAQDANADKLREEGDAAMTAKNYPEVVAKYSEYLKLTNYEDESRIFNCAFAAYNAKKYDDAIKFYDMAIQKGYKADDAYVGKAMSLRSQDKAADFTATVEAGLKANAQNANLEKLLYAYCMKKGQAAQKAGKTEEAEEKYGLRIFTAWTYAEDEQLKYQNDHAGANETSIVMAVRPDLVDFGQVKEDESNLIGIAGRHPVRDSSAAFGNEILEYTMKTLISGIEKEYKEIKDRQN